MLRRKHQLEKIVSTLSTEIQTDDLSQEPLFYKEILSLFSSKKIIPDLLRSEYLIKHDESILSFIRFLRKHVFIKLNKSITIANMCSGSCLLSDELRKNFNSFNIRITDFDSSELMRKFSKNFTQIDLKQNNFFKKKFDMVILHGALRYFITHYNILLTNLLSSSTLDGKIIIADTNLSLFKGLISELKEKKLSYQFYTEECTVFRNTLFYMLLYQCEIDPHFKNMVSSEACNENLNNLLIKLAGFKKSPYHYLVFQKNEFSI